MGLLRALNKIRGGYPGGWKRYARGYQGDRPPPFVQPHDPDDRRSLIPARGLREYWYPALPAQAVGWCKPVGLRLLGTDLVFFRDTHGEVQALWDYCPHRGVYLSLGKCVWRGYLSCAYHGATFNGKGECRVHHRRAGLQDGRALASPPLPDPDAEGHGVRVDG